MFNVTINSNKAWVTRRETLTMYSAGNETVQICLDFSDEWENLARIAVFRADAAQIDVAVSGETVEIPVNVLLQPNVHLMLGLYGISADGTVVIPTIWADLGIIQAAADPTAADNFGPPAMDLYAQLAALTRAAQSAASTAASGVYAGSVSFAVDASGHLIMTVTEDGDETPTDLGAVSAYAAALDAGYEGSYAEFKALLIANARTAYDVDAALAAAESVAGIAQTANTNASSALSAAGSASNAAAAASTAAAAAQTSADAKQAKVKTMTVTLSSGLSSWSNLSAPGVTASNLVIWGAAPASFDAAAAALVRMTAQGADVVSFEAAEAISEDITMNLAVFDL